MTIEIIGTTEADSRALLAQARRHVRQQLPGAFEANDHMAGIVTFAYGAELSDLACMIAPHSGGPMIGFYNADDFAASARLLHPRGVRHRYLEIASLEELYTPALDELLSEVRRRHRDSATPHDGGTELVSRSSPRRNVVDRPASETLASLLIGLMTGALFAEFLDSRMAGLTLGIVFSVALLWIGRSRSRSSG